MSNIQQMGTKNLKDEIDLRMNLNPFERKIFDLLGGNFAGIKKRGFVEKLLVTRKQFIFYYEENSPLSLNDLMEYPMMLAYKMPHLKYVITGLNAHLVR
uniref:Uncharacterized protein n=1 Tax=Ditylenchus dipsaci TaxID=166011 RepID=A0A915DDR0_9BILA